MIFSNISQLELRSNGKRINDRGYLHQKLVPLVLEYPTTIKCICHWSPRLY